uniref:Immunoglobulin domain-containing protein n=1 Tax=Callorhinchus milii TaxID=7868 RepID=A0A4W3HHN7_CALMI
MIFAASHRNPDPFSSNRQKIEFKIHWLVETPTNVDSKPLNPSDQPLPHNSSLKQQHNFEGQNVTLNCSYSTMNAALWYRQYPDGALQYLFRIYSSGKVDNPPDRFTAELIKENKVIKLQILSAVVGDSAVYYCALETTLLQEGRFPVHKLSRQPST